MQACRQHAHDCRQCSHRLDNAQDGLRLRQARLFLACRHAIVGRQVLQRGFKVLLQLNRNLYASASTACAGTIRELMPQAPPRLSSTVGWAALFCPPLPVFAQVQKRCPRYWAIYRQQHNISHDQQPNCCYKKQMAFTNSTLAQTI